MIHRRSPRGVLTPAALVRAVGALLLVVGIVTCRDQVAGPSPVLGSVAVAPVFPSGQFVGGNLPIDHVHAVVVRPAEPTKILRDVTKPFSLNVDALNLKLDLIPLESPAESLDVTIELLSGTTVLFRATQRLEAASGPTPPAAPLLPLTFVGPGSQLAALFLAPPDSTLTQGDNLPLRVSGEDASQLPVPNFYVSWSISDTTVARVNGDGRVTGKVPRGMVYVRARTPATTQAPTGVVESTTVTLLPLPASLVKVGGDNQSAPIGAVLPLPLAVEVRAADNLPVPGATVLFAVATGGGSVDSASATSDAAGVARSGATLGGTLGSNTFTARVTGIGTVTFTATATLAPAPTWTGAVSTDWSTAGNWSTNAVPAGTDDVVIPNVANDPVIGVGGLSVNNMTVAAGAAVGMAQGFSFTVNGSLSLSGTYSCINCNLTVLGPITTVAGSTLSPSVLVAHGSLTVGGTFGVSSMNFNGVNQAIPAGLPYLSVAVAGSAFLTGRTTISSGIDTYGSGSLALNGHTLVVGLFQVGQAPAETATFTMSSSLDSIIAVNVLLQGGSTAGKLTAGVIVATGNFSQQSLNSIQAFSASGSHKVVLSGTGVQNVNLQTSSAANSHFQDLEVSNAVAVSFLKDATVNGRLISQTAGPSPIVQGTGTTLTVAGTLINTLIVDTLPLVIGGGTISQFDDVIFSHTLPTATALTMAHAGAATPFVFTDLVFQVTPTTGKYMSVTDNTADANVLTINMVAPTPGTPGGFVQTAGGAVVNWPSIAPGARDWTGATSTDWNDPTNWNPAVVPTALDQVTIGPAARQPALTAASMASSVIIAGAGARLTIGGQTLTVGTLTVHTDGLLAMTNPADLVVVTGDAAFQGGDENGFLTAGELRLAGNFNQTQQTSTRSFFATGTHRTVMNGSALQTVTFCCTAAASGFRELDLSSSVGINIQFSGNGVFVYDTLISQVGAGAAPLLYTLGSTLTAARLRVDKLVVDRGTLVLNENGVAANQQLDNVTFQNFLTTFTQLSIVAPGGAPRNLTFNNLTFQPLVAGNTGKYLSVTAPSGTLVVDLPGASPGAGGNGPAFTTTSGAVTVNWPTAPAGITWNGSVSTNWSTPGNWTPANVPTNADDVTIPVTGNNPLVTVSCSAKSILVNTGATLNLNGFNCQVQGNVFSDGTIAGPGAVQMQAAGSVHGTVPSLIISAAVSLDGTTSVTNTATVTGAGGLLTLAGHSMTVNGNFTVQGGALLDMTNVADVLTMMSGTALFNGGDETGHLTAGLLDISGDFTQGASNSASFRATGVHRTRFSGSLTKLISFATVGTSQFNILDVSNSSGTINLGNNAQAQDQLVSTPAAGFPTIAGNGHVLTVGGFNVTGLNLNNALLNSVRGTMTAFSNVTFSGFGTTQTQLSVAHDGTAAPFVFDNLTFNTTPTSGGLYLDATDLAPANGFPLTINVTNSTPASGAPFVGTASGAVVNWPFGGAGFTWTGATNTDWDTGSNWSGGTVPTFTDNAVIPSAPNNQPTINSAADGVNDLTVQAGATLTIGPSAGLVVNGNMDASGSVVSSTGVMVLTGVGKTVKGNLANMSVTGSYALAGNAALGIGNVATISGSLFLNAHTLTTTDFTTVSSGLLVMTGSTDSLIVGGIAVFDGGNESGNLTAGVIVAQGDFVQVNSTSPNSFAASSGLKVVFTGSGPQNLSFMTPGLGSQFGALEVNGTGVVFMLSDIQVSAAGITVSKGTLESGGHTLRDLGTFVTNGSGTLTMLNATDSVLVSGAATFGGGDENGLLDNGILVIGGSFGQNNSGGSNSSFAASGTHTTRIGAAAVRVINFGTPSQFATGSHFANLDVTPGTGGITLVNGNNFANGQLISTPAGAAPSLSGGVLTVHQLNVSAPATSLILNNVRITLIEQAIVPEVFDHVQFVGFGSINNQLDINAFGTSLTPRVISFPNLTFSPLTTGASAVYVRLTSINGQGITVTLPSSSQSPGGGGNGPTFSNPPNQTTSGGATILWP